MTLEKLTFGDLIAHSDAIIINADALKVRVNFFCCKLLIISIFLYVIP